MMNMRPLGGAASGPEAGAILSGAVTTDSRAPQNRNYSPVDMHIEGCSHPQP